MKIKITAFLLCFLLLFAGCGEREAVVSPSESENEDIISELTLDENGVAWS